MLFYKIRISLSASWLVFCQWQWAKVQSQKSCSQSRNARSCGFCPFATILLLYFPLWSLGDTLVSAKQNNCLLRESCSLASRLRPRGWLSSTEPDRECAAVDRRNREGQAALFHGCTPILLYCVFWILSPSFMCTIYRIQFSQLRQIQPSCIVGHCNAPLLLMLTYLVDDGNSPGLSPGVATPTLPVFREGCPFVAEAYMVSGGEKPKSFTLQGHSHRCSHHWWGGEVCCFLAGLVVVSGSDRG